MFETCSLVMSNVHKVIDIFTFMICRYHIYIYTHTYLYMYIYIYTPYCLLPRPYTLLPMPYCLIPHRLLPNPSLILLVLLADEVHIFDKCQLPQNSLLEFKVLEQVPPNHHTGLKGWGSPNRNGPAPLRWGLGPLAEAPGGQGVYYNPAWGHIKILYKAPILAYKIRPQTY